MGAGAEDSRGGVPGPDHAPGQGQGQGPARDDVGDRVALEFLAAAAADARSAGLRPLEEYLARFPGHDARLSAEYAALQDDGATSTARTTGAWGSAGAASAAASDSAHEDPDTSTSRLGPFRLLRPLGRGGQGIVHLAEDTRFGREVALKLLPGFLGGVPARLRREVEALARLDHPGLGVVHEAGETDGQAWVAMRYVPGRTLAAHIEEDRERTAAAGPTRAEVRERAGLVEQVARALHAAHEAGVLHRDVKPANVLVHEETGEPVLVDFGLARADDSTLPTLTRTGDLLGTTPYMAPERLHGEGARDRRQDVWSLGVVLYELLTSRRPFDGPTVEAVARRIEWEEPRDPRRLARNVPRDLAVVVATALAKNPAERYPTALALAEDLARVRDGRPVLARPVGPAGRAWRWAKRNPAPAALLAVLVVGLAATVLVALELSDLADRERGARRTSQALLAKSSHEQARLLALSDTPGRRWRILELLAQAAAALREAGGPEGLGAADVDAGLVGAGDLDVDDLPTPTDLRSAATEALLLADGRLERVVQSSTFGQGRFDPSGEVVGLSFVTPDFTSFGIFTQSVRTGRELVRMADAELVSAVYAVGVESGGRHVLTTNRDLAHLDVWRTEDVTRLHQVEVPESIRPTESTSTWHLELLPDGVHLAGVVGPEKIGHHGPSGLLVGRRDRAEPVLVRAEPTFADPWLAVSRDGRHLLAPSGLMHVRVVTLPDPDAPNATDESAFAELRIDVGLPVLTATFVEATADVPPAPAGPPVSGATPAGRDATPAPPRRLAAACRELERSSDVLVLMDLAEDGTVTRRRERELGFHLPLYAPLTPSRDGATVWIADLARGLHALDARDGHERLTLAGIHDRRITDIAALADGRVVTHADQGTTRLWEMQADPGLAAPLPWPDGDVVAAFPATSEDGRVVAVHAAPSPERPGAGGTDAVVLVRLADGTTHRLLAPPDDDAPRGPRALPTDEPQLVLSADGDRLARLTPGTITLWQLGDAPPDAVTFAADDGARWLSVALPPEGPAVAVQADADGHVTWRELATGASRPWPGMPAEAWLHLSPDARRLFVVPAQGARPPSWLSTGTPFLAHPGDPPRATDLTGLPPDAFREVRTPIFSDDGRWLAAHVFLPNDAPTAAVADNLVLVWRIADADLRLSVPREDELRGAPPDLSPDGRWLAFADDDGRVRLFDVTTGTEVLSWRAHRAHLTGVRFLRGGQALLTADRDGEAWIWDLAALGEQLEALGLGW